MTDKLIDPYLNDLNCVKRLVNEWVKHKSLVIAYDYDNTVFDYHNTGYKFDSIISTLKECKEYGGKFIVFSCSPKDRHSEMIKYLGDKDIPWDTINENIVFLHGGEGKIFYNILLDDRAGLKSSFSILTMALTVIKLNPKDENEACEILSKIYGKRITC
jgi:hypothetical protein